MEDLNSCASDDEADRSPMHGIDPTDDLLKVIRNLCANRDVLRQEIDPDEVLIEIEQKHPKALLRRGAALARKACRRLITGHLRAMAALDPHQDETQIALPGLERIPSHTMYPVPVPNSKRFKIVARHTRDATREQHRACLQLKRTNTQRCIAREAQHQRIIDLLDASGCDSLREWEDRYAKGAA